jgi:hypothetical protein
MKLLIAGCILALASLAPARADENGAESERLPFKIPGEQSLPEFADVAAWVNSKPLKRADLHGKVVVVHFLTFG